MINKLTPAQIARFPEFVDKWTRIGLSTEPADRARAEAGIELAYKVAGLYAPKIVWCGSPLSNALTRALVNKNSVGDSVWAYTGSLFYIWGDTYQFQPCVDLWRRGLIPSFDGKTWRLHSGKKSEIVYEWTPSV